MFAERHGSLDGAINRISTNGLFVPAAADLKRWLEDARRGVGQVFTFEASAGDGPAGQLE